MYRKVCFTCRIVSFFLCVCVLDQLFSLPSPFRISQFYYLFEKIVSIVKGAWLLALAKSIYYVLKERF